MSQSSESKIDRLRRRLDSQNPADFNTSRNQLSYGGSGDNDIPTGWQHDEEPSQEPESQKESMSFLNKLLIFASIFFIAAFAFAAYTIGFTDSNISPDNVVIEINAPSSVSAGDTATFDINIKNENKVALHSAELVIVYPDGTREPENTGQDLRQQREEIGTIPANGQAEIRTKATLFGERGDVNEISVQLEYKVQDSNAIFLATNTGEIEISEAPISLDISSPTEASLNELFEMEITVTSNASRNLDDVILVIDYPFGFVPEEIDPTPDYRDYIWQLGDIEPGEEIDITVDGRFSNVSASDQQAFRFDVGTIRSNDNTAIGTLFASQDIVVNLREAFINVGLDIETDENRSGNIVDINGQINWRSNLDSTVRGGEIIATFSGAGIDMDTLSSRDGIVRSGDSTIIWNSRTNDNLIDINPDNEGSQRFSLSTRNSESLASIVENPTVDIAIRMQAQSTGDSSLPDTVTTNIERSIKLPTVADMEVRTLHDDGPLENTGPIPPQVDQTTTYTIHLSVSNTTNEITDASFQAALPAYVNMGDGVSPLNANVDYNNVSGRLTWDIGTIPAGAGFTKPAEEVYIQVEITPTSRQTGSTVRLLADPSITGTDSFTGSMLQIRDINVPTTGRDDTQGSDDGQVQN
ncbi:MAG: hypothetical protein WD335_04010 [Candidatus Paceibacterota bacterium]